METFLQILVLISVAIIGITTLFLTVISAHRLKKVREFGSKIYTWKSVLARANIIAIVASIPLQIIILVIDSNEKKDQATKQKNTDEALIANFKTTIDTANETLKSTRAVLDSLKQIQAQVLSQLELQRRLNLQAGSILSLNQKITGQERQIYRNVDQLLNPIFPLDITIIITFPFDEENVAGLREFATVLMTKQGDIPGSKKIEIQKIGNEVSAEIVRPDSILKDNALNEFYALTNYNISFIKGKRALTFNLSTSDKSWKSFYSTLIIDYTHKKFMIKLGFNDCQFTTNQFTPLSTGNLSFNDIVGSTFKFFPVAGVSKYNLLIVGLIPKSGLRTEYRLLFNKENDHYSDRFNEKWYIHKIGQWDLKINQESEIYNPDWE
jgi:hypothetical protein